MGFFDFLGDLSSSIGDVAGNLGSDISSFFGGGSGVSDVFDAGNVNLLPSGLDPSSLSSGFDFGSTFGGADLLGGLSSLAGGGGDLFSGSATFNPSSVNLGLPGAGTDPSNLFPAGSTFSPNGLNIGSAAGMASGPLKTALSSPSGGGTTNPATAPVTAPTQGPAATGGQSQTPTNLPTGTSSGGGVLGGLLSNPTALLAAIGPLMGAINAKDQTDLGPDAAKLRTMADQNQNLITSLTGEAQAEKVGNLPGPAMGSLAQSLAEQKAGVLSRYQNMGMSGSSAEAADLAALNQQNESQRFQIGLNMAQEGLSQVTGLQTQDVGIYQELMNAQAQRDQEYMQAMADLADGLGKAFSGAGANPASTQTTPAQAGGGTPAAPVTDPTFADTFNPSDVSLLPQTLTTLPDPSSLFPTGGTFGAAPVTASLPTPSTLLPSGASFNPANSNIDLSNLFGSVDLSAYL